MGESVQVLQSAVFKRAYKRLHPNQKADVDGAVVDIVRDPHIGEAKKGDLAGVFVHKFKVNKQEVLLSYKLAGSNKSRDELILLAIGSHENFYRDMKR